MSHTLTAYRVAPQREWKAAAELRDAGIRAYVPRERTAKRKTPIARGYVFARTKPPFSEHVRSAVGNLPPSDLARLYQSRQEASSAVRFAVGDLVAIRVGAHADVIGTIDRPAKRGWMVATVMFGKRCVTYVQDRYVHSATRAG